MSDKVTTRKDLIGMGIELVNIKIHLLKGGSGSTKEHLLEHIENAMLIYDEVSEAKLKKQLLVDDFMKQLSKI